MNVDDPEQQHSQEKATMNDSMVELEARMTARFEAMMAKQADTQMDMMAKMMENMTARMTQPPAAPVAQAAPAPAAAPAFDSRIRAAANAGQGKKMRGDKLHAYIESQRATARRKLRSTCGKPTTVEREEREYLEDLWKRAESRKAPPNSKPTNKARTMFDKWESFRELFGETPEHLDGSHQQYLGFTKLNPERGEKGMLYSLQEVYEDGIKDFVLNSYCVNEDHLIEVLGLRRSDETLPDPLDYLLHKVSSDKLLSYCRGLMSLPEPSRRIRCTRDGKPAKCQRFRGSGSVAGANHAATIVSLLSNAAI